MPTEERLGGGNASGTVVRVGETVRKRWTPATPSVTRFITAVRAAGVEAPAPLGRDEHGRQVLQWIPGRLASKLAPLSREQLRSIGAVIRDIHDASLGFTPTGEDVWESAIPAPGSELICHNDLAPWNLVLPAEEGGHPVFIDWDAAGPSTRLWDLAYAAMTFALSEPSRAAVDAAGDLSALVEGYAPEPSIRRTLAEAVVRRAEAMYTLLSDAHRIGRQPWAAMFTNGHGAHWDAVRSYVRANEPLWDAALNTALR